MYEEGKSKRISKEKGDKEATGPRSPLNWKIYSVEELIKFRDEITNHLPPLSLKDIDMEQELLLQFRALRALQNDVISDEETPVNQKAQIGNSVSSVLAKMGEMQQTLYDSERLKRIEKILVSVLDTLPQETKEAFLAAYEAELEKV